MFIVRAKQKHGAGFTLLEIMMAVAILAMVAMAIYRFVATNMAAVQASAAETAANARYNGFINLINSQMQQLSTEGGILGDPYKFSDQSQDEMSWIASSGPGLCTRYAPGEYVVSMRLKRSETNNNKMDIGFMRKPRDTPDGSDEGQSWVPVLEDVRGLEIRYFDARLPAWVDKWTDTTVMPRLVKLVIGCPDRRQPLETIIALARTPLQIQPQLPQLPLTPGAAGLNPNGQAVPNTGGTQPGTNPGTNPSSNPGKPLGK
jgi:prepilin-type N-terminal cleavage/methylation domain-containing protein